MVLLFLEVLAALVVLVAEAGLVAGGVLAVDEASVGAVLAVAEVSAAGCSA